MHSNSQSGLATYTPTNPNLVQYGLSDTPPLARFWIISSEDEEHALEYELPLRTLARNTSPTIGDELLIDQMAYVGGTTAQYRVQASDQETAASDLI